MISEAYHFQDSTPEDLHPQRMIHAFSPLTKGSYPVFNKYPQFIVDYQVLSSHWYVHTCVHAYCRCVDTDMRMYVIEWQITLLICVFYIFCFVKNCRHAVIWVSAVDSVCTCIYGRTYCRCKSGSVFDRKRWST